MSSSVSFRRFLGVPNLPKLLSGEIRVKDVEKFVGDEA